MSKIICCNVNSCPLLFAISFAGKASSITRPIRIVRIRIGGSSQALWLRAKRCEKVLAA